MTSTGVVPALDVAEDGHPRPGVRTHEVPVKELALEAGEEALAHGAVAGASNGAHRGDDTGKESAVGAIIVKKADPKLRYAVRANDRISLWEFDERLEVRQVA